MTTARQVATNEDSDDDEEERARLAAIASSGVVIDSADVVRNAAPSVKRRNHSNSKPLRPGVEAAGDGPSSLKHYQIRGQDLLHQFLDKSLEVSEQEAGNIAPPKSEPEPEEDIRLFRHAPPGCYVEKPEIRHDVKARDGHESSDESPEHDSHLQAVAVDGIAILAQAEKENSRAKAAAEGAAAAAKLAAEREEARLALLKKQRGEEWLPSVAPDLGLGSKVPIAGKKRKRRKKKAGSERVEYSEETLTVA